MGRRKIMVWLLALALLLFAAAVSLLESPPETKKEPLPLSLVIATGEESQTISCWEQEEGVYYFFLPAYAGDGQVTFQVDRQLQVAIGGTTISNGFSADGFEKDTPYPMEIHGKGQNVSGSLVFLQSARVPAIYIDVSSGTMEYIHREKGNEEPGTIRVYSSDGDLEYDAALQSINARGNITWERGHGKKPYSVTLNAEADLLGLGAAQKWILQSNPFDESHLRNKAVFDFAREAGLSYSPDSTWADLYLNGEYAGLYLLCERNEIHPQRVDIAQNGSTLVSIDMGDRMARQGYPHIVVDADTALRLHSGEKVTDEMTAFWKSVDNAIQAGDGIDPVTGKHYLEFIDLDSWSRKYLLEEMFGNVEASAVSHYFYIDGSEENGKIYAGPVWDYDYALGSGWAWQTKAVNGLFCAKAYIWQETDTPWFYALWQKAEFRDTVIALYEREYRPLMEKLLESGFDRYADQIREAARMNRIRWQTEDAGKNTESMKDYLSRRLEFLDSLWLQGETYHKVTVNMNNGGVVSCYCVKPGETLPPLPDITLEEDAIGWYDYDTGEPVDISEPVYGDRRIYVKREEAAPQEEGLARQVIRYGPFAGLLMLLIPLVCCDRIRRKRMDERKHERTKANQISP